MNEQAAAQWLDALQAACLLAIDPHSFGGIRVRAGAGPVRDHWLACLRAIWPDAPPLRRVPASIDSDRLLGGLDLPATLSAGKPVMQAGLLAELNGMLALLPMAEKLSPGPAAIIGDCLERSRVEIQRDGFDLSTQTEFVVIAFDESSVDEPPPATALIGRLGLDIDLEGLSAVELLNFGQPDELAIDSKTIVKARLELNRHAFDEQEALALCSLAMNFGVSDSRADWFVVRACRAASALNLAQTGDAQASDAMSLAARLVLLPRATRLPVSEPPPEQEPPAEQASESSDQAPSETDQTAPEPDQTSDAEDDAEQTFQSVDEQTEILLEAVIGSMPQAVREALATGSATRLRSGATTGRSQQRVTGRSRGRPVGVERGSPSGGRRLHLTETLRAAVPWQRLRKGQSDRTGIRVMPDDFRVRRYKQRGSSLSLFLVDASGSAAMRRLGEAKGAVELLLADCYVRRDQVALIAFRGQGAQLLLAPTRSLARARRELAQLPGGGGTPLASGLKMAVGLVDQAVRDGLSVSLVIMTDGQANVGLDGQGGRQQAREDAHRIARVIASRSVKSIVVDLSVRPSDRPEELARSLNGVCLSLPFADARRLDRVIRQERESKDARV